MIVRPGTRRREAKTSAASESGRPFREELDTTPARYVESTRCDIAKSLLDQGHTATQAAATAGFPSYESLRRVFGREPSTSPAAYQRRFATTRREPVARPAKSV